MCKYVCVYIYFLMFAVGCGLLTARKCGSVSEEWCRKLNFGWTNVCANDNSVLKTVLRHRNVGSQRGWLAEDK